MIPALVDQVRSQRHDHAVEPRGAGSERNQRVHVGGAVARRAPGAARRIAPAADDLDERRRHSASQLSVSSEIAFCGRYIAMHQRQPRRPGSRRDWISSRRCDRALDVRSGIDRRQRRGVQLGLAGLRSNVVARPLDGRDQLGSPGQRRVDADGRLLGGEVHVRLDHAVGLAQEALDPVDARGAGHPVDGQDDLDRRLLVILPGSIQAAVRPGRSRPIPRPPRSRRSARGEARTSSMPARRRRGVGADGSRPAPARASPTGRARGRHGSRRARP